MLKASDKRWPQFSLPPISAEIASAAGALFFVHVHLKLIQTSELNSADAPRDSFLAAHVVFNDDGQMMLPCFIAIAGVLYGLFAITTLHLSVTRVWLGVSTILNFIYIDVPFLFSINEGINTPVTAYSIPGTTTNKKFTTIGTSAKPVFAFNTGIIPEIQATIKQSVVKKMMKALYCPFSAGLLTINVSGPFWMKEMANIVAFFQLVITLNIFTSPMNEYLDTKYKIHGSRFAILNLTFRIGVRGLKATMQGFTEKIVQMMKNKKLFASQDGPDILSQIENEYGRESKAYSAAGHSYINRATTQAIELDTEVPWVRCKADDASDTIVMTGIMRFHSIDEITPEPKKWILQVRVSRSWTAIHAKHKYVLHKDYIFIDAKGKDIWGQIPEVLISKFQNLLEDQKEHVTTLGVSPKSPKSCVSALHSATPQSSKQAANSKDKFKVAAIQFNEDDQDELSDDVPLATMRKRLKRRRCQISDDE
ncbi:Proline transporter 2 [Linum perenne]